MSPLMLGIFGLTIFVSNIIMSVIVGTFSDNLSPRVRGKKIIIIMRYAWILCSGITMVASTNILVDYLFPR